MAVTEESTVVYLKKLELPASQLMASRAAGALGANNVASGRLGSSIGMSI